MPYASSHKLYDSLLFLDFECIPWDLFILESSLITLLIYFKIPFLQVLTIVRRKRMFVEQQKSHFKHDSQTHCQLKYRMPSANNIQYKFIPFQCITTCISSSVCPTGQTDLYTSIFELYPLNDQL